MKAGELRCWCRSCKTKKWETTTEKDEKGTEHRGPQSEGDGEGDSQKTSRDLRVDPVLEGVFDRGRRTGLSIRVDRSTGRDSRDHRRV